MPQPALEFFHREQRRLAEFGDVGEHGDFTASTNLRYVGRSYAASAKMVGASLDALDGARSMAASTPKA